MEGDFAALSTAGINQAKLADANKQANTKAEKSVTHSILRKSKMPPSEAELKKQTKSMKEAIKEDTKLADKTRIAAVKVICTKYVNYFGEGKYPEIKNIPKPPPTAELDVWEDYLAGLASVIGSSKADLRFWTYLDMFGRGLEHLNLIAPEMFGHYSIRSPVSFAQVLSSPQFKAEIDDEQKEIIFQHASWFQSGKWERLVMAVGKVGMAVAQNNKAAATAAVLNPENIQAAINRPSRFANEQRPIPDEGFSNENN